MNNDLLNALLRDDSFIKKVQAGLAKNDTINNATGLLWYDLAPIIQLMYPFKELIPLISKLPRVPGDGGNAYNWKRVTAINSTNLSAGVSEGNRGARITVQAQSQLATYKTMGLEGSATFEARLGGKNLSPDALGNVIQSTLRATMIQEEQVLILGNASTALGTCPTPSLVAGTVTGVTGTLAATTWYVKCVALSGFGFQNYTPWNNSTSTGGVPGQVTKTNADGTVDTFGGGSGQPSAEASVTVASVGQCITGTVAGTVGAVGYAWFAGTTSGAEKFVGLTQGTEVIIKSTPASTNQPITSLQVNSAYQDNSTNALLPDGILSQIFGSVFGTAPGTYMATGGGVLPTNVSLTAGGSIVYTCLPGNTGLTISGTNIAEFDVVLQTAYNLYKVGFSKILVSASDLGSFSASMLQEGSAGLFRILFDADATTGRIVAGRRVTSYLNKWFGNTLDIEVHPYLPPGTVIFWSDHTPYELADVPNVLEAKVRQDYYQIQWPLFTRRYEYGVYVDEVFACYFTPGFAAIIGLNPGTGVQIY